MKKAGLLAILALFAAGLLLSPPASADHNIEEETRNIPPSDGFILINEVQWMDGTNIEDCERWVLTCEPVPRKLVMQQWESDREDAYILRTFSNGFVEVGWRQRYRRTYRGTKVVKPTPGYAEWDFNSSNMDDEIESLRYPARIYPFYSQDSTATRQHRGFDMRFKRSDFKAGKYTVLYTDPYRVTDRFVCSETFFVGCYYDNSRKQMTWHAYTFNVDDRTVSNLRERGKRAWTSKQFQKQLSKLLKR